MEPRTIVVVDDEQDMTRFMRSVLEAEGHRVLTAANGREGVETVLEAQPDLVFMDALMPVVQGQEACQYLKGQKGLEETKIVMVSSLPVKDLERFRTQGADAFLHKPVGVRDVLDTVERLLA